MSPSLDWSRMSPANSSIASGRTLDVDSGRMPRARVILLESGWPIACSSVSIPASIMPCTIEWSRVSG